MSGTILNVIGWMDWLLEHTVEKLCAVDCTLLLMSAYVHDLDMALPEEQYHELLDETAAPTDERRKFEALNGG